MTNPNGHPTPTAVLSRDLGPDMDPRHTALQELAGLLRGQKYDVKVENLHLTTTNPDNGRWVEVWAQRRPDDEYRLWFTWTGSIPISEVTNPADAVVAIKRALRQIPTRQT